jgi:hypothetical protein
VGARESQCQNRDAATSSSAPYLTKDLDWSGRLEEPLTTKHPARDAELMSVLVTRYIKSRVASMQNTVKWYSAGNGGTGIAFGSPRTQSSPEVVRTLVSCDTWVTVESTMSIETM